MAKIIFQREKCSSTHVLKSDAELCEAKHLEVTRQDLVYIQYDTKSKYPKEVKLWFDGVNCVTYIRESERR